MRKVLSRNVALAAALSLMSAAGCSDRDPNTLDVARARVDPLVFDEDFGSDVYFQAFFETHLTAIEVDSEYAFGGYAPDGARSLKINIPAQDSALGIYSGGVLTSAASRDLADFNALTFYARADVEIGLNEVGFGNDNTGTSRYGAGRSGLALTRDWAFFVVPIPNSAKLIAERGLFTFAEGLEQSPPNSGNFPYPDGYNIWIDEIRFAKLGNISVFRSSMPSVNRQYFVGSKVTVANPNTVFDVDGGFVIVNHTANYFDFTSTNPSVATVTPRGEVRIVGVGTASVTARLGDKDVLGAINTTGYAPPSVAAALPIHPANQVISMFGEAYPNVFVENWRANWGGSTTVVEDFEVAGRTTRMYSALNFVGITFENSTIDASSMDFLHLDVYAPAGSEFKVKLVSFPTEVGVETTDLVLDATTTPAFSSGGWSSLDIPLADFSQPEGWDWSRVGQMVLSSSNTQLVLLDNIYWHQ